MRKTENEFGIELDQAGYAPSIMEPARACCALCGRRFGVKLDRHEPWGGLANREKSKALGLWVSLCHFGCHEGPGSIHDDPELNRELRRRVQAQAMAVYGWDLDEWRSRFGKNELSDEDAANVYAVPDVFSRGRRSEKGRRESTAPCIGGFLVLADGPELPF
jgi:hypothetical protein